MPLVRLSNWWLSTIAHFSCTSTSAMECTMPGASGIGAALSRHLASEGASVVAADVADPAWDAGDLDVTHLRADVSDETSWRELVSATLDRHGRIDALVNNAAIYQDLGAKRPF